MLKNRVGETRTRFAWFPVCKMARPNPFTRCIGYYWWRDVVETRTSDGRWLAYEVDNGA